MNNTPFSASNAMKEYLDAYRNTQGELDTPTMVEGDPFFEQALASLSYTYILPGDELPQSMVDGLRKEISIAKEEAINKASDALNERIGYETDALAETIAEQDKKQAQALLDKAKELGTQISEVTHVTETQVQQITLITASNEEAAAAIEVERQARITADAAEASIRETLATEMGGNISSINTVVATKADKDEVASLARTTLQSEWKNYTDDKVDGVSAKVNWQVLTAAQNLNSMLTQGNYFIPYSNNTNAPIANWLYLVVDVPRTDRVTQTVWADTDPKLKYMRNKYGSTWSAWEKAITDNELKVVSAKLVDFKKTTATKDEAQTEINNIATSRIDNAVSSIESLQTTKANKDEVVAMARTGLASEWRSEADSARVDAISVAATDAELKAKAAEQAAQAYASAEAEAKSVIAKAYADGIVTAEEQRAIDDANAKLALAKADAKEKADAAEASAKAYADLQVGIVDNKVSVVSAELKEFKQTTASKDQAQTVVNNQALSRLDTAESSITSMQTTKANKDEVSSLARTALSSEWKDYTDDKVNDISVGGRNLLSMSALNHGNVGIINEYVLTLPKPASITFKTKGLGEACVVSFKIRKTSGSILTIGGHAGASMVINKVTRDGVDTDSPSNQWLDMNYTNDEAYHKYCIYFIDNTVPVTFYIQIGRGDGYSTTYSAELWDIQLVRGTKATDWTPSIEDFNGQINTVAADLTSFKKTTATKDAAQTTINNIASSRLNSAESSIRSFQTTKANKDEVSSLARTGLKSEWQSAATTAKSEAIAAAASDAKSKADAAKEAAQTYAAAQVDAKSVSDKAYADGLVTAEEQRAINDANAKLAAAKVDAKTKADAAEAAAKAHTDLKVNSIEIGGRNYFVLNEILSSTLKVGAYGAWQTYLEPETTYTLHIKALVSSSNAWLKIYNGDTKTGQTRWVYLGKQSAENITYVFTTIDTGEIWLTWYGRNPADDILVEPQIYKGTVKQDWAPAPEDVAAQITVVTADLDDFKETTATKDAAQTTFNTTALSRISTSEGKISTLQNTSVTKDSAQSVHTIKTEALANGRRAIAGITVGAMANSTTAESEVIVMANKFGVVTNTRDTNVKPMFTVVNNQVAVNGDLVADGTILGKHIKANQTLTAPVINGGELNINNRFIVDKYGNTTIQSSAGKVGLKITDERIEVYDDNGVLRVRLGGW